jgi:hypothetical protein
MADSLRGNAGRRSAGPRSAGPLVRGPLVSESGREVPRGRTPRRRAVPPVQAPRARRVPSHTVRVASPRHARRRPQLQDRGRGVGRHRPRRFVPHAARLREAARALEVGGRRESSAPTTFCSSPTGGWVDPLRTVSSCHQDQCWRRSPVDGAAPRPRPPAPGVQSGFAISLLHRSQSAASSLTFSVWAAARSFFSPMSSARLNS